jgi:hypothetical protein
LTAREAAFSRVFFFRLTLLHVTMWPTLVEQRLTARFFFATLGMWYQDANYGIRPVVCLLEEANEVAGGGQP